MTATWKKDTVSELAKKMKISKVVGLVSISGIPSKQMQLMRKELKEDVDLRVSRSSLISRALKKAGIEGMEEYLKGPCGIAFSELNPFQLEKTFSSRKTTAPAKTGSTAPYDLVVQEGDTGLPAGPVIGDLQRAGVKAKIQGGKIVVTEDSVVAREGERIEDNVATVLTRLGIEPREIQIRIIAAYEDGIVYPGDVLHIEEPETIGKLQNAYNKAFNLAYNARVYNKATIEMLLYEGICNTRNLMVNAEIINKETIPLYLGKASAAAKALKAALPPELQAEVKEEEAAAEGKPAKEEEEAAPEDKKPEAEEKKEEKPAAPEEKKEDAAPEEKKSGAEEKPAEKKEEVKPKEEKAEAPAEEK